MIECKLHACLLLAAVTGAYGIEADEPHTFVYSYPDTAPWFLYYQHVQQTVISTTANTGTVRFQVPARSTDNVYDIATPITAGPYFLEERFSWKENETGRHTSFDAYRIASDRAVYVEAGMQALRSGDGMRVLPLTTASTEFYVSSFRSYGPDGNKLRSLFLVVSAYNDTRVEAYYNHPGGSDQLVNRRVGELEVTQVFATENRDFTGAYVKSSRPVAVIGGHECANIPYNKDTCDFIFDMSAPVSEWGTDHIVGPILGRRDRSIGYILRAVAGYDATEVEIKGGGAELAYIRNRGGFTDINVANTEHIMTVTCSKPCMVAQYNKGMYAISNDDHDKPSDPFMMLITPNDHFTNNMTFSTLWDIDGEGNLTEMRSFLTVVAPDNARTGVLLNNQPIAELTENGWVGAKLGRYSVISFPIEHGVYRLYHPDYKVKLMGYAYGHGKITNARTAYGFAVGYEMFGIPSDIRWAPGIEECARNFRFHDSIRGDVTCPRLQSLRGVSLSDCRKRACYMSSNAFVYDNKTCQLYRCGDRITMDETQQRVDVYAMPGMKFAPIEEPRQPEVLPLWAIVVIAVGGVLVLVVIVTLAIICSRRNKRKPKTDNDVMSIEKNLDNNKDPDDIGMRYVKGESGIYNEISDENLNKDGDQNPYLEPRPTNTYLTLQDSTEHYDQIENVVEGSEPRLKGEDTGQYTSMAGRGEPADNTVGYMKMQQVEGTPVKDAYDI